MQVIRTVSEMRQWRDDYGGMSVGFVPTMGHLHEGHLSLVHASTEANEQTVVSVYVNPTQFGPSEDFAEYPRNLDRDCVAMNDEAVDVVFAPCDEEMYPTGFSTYVEVEGSLTGRLCGESRETHFRGVTTIVSRLLNIVRPKRAYFGEKDAQQLAVIRRMVCDMQTPVEIVGCPTVRSEDGLALSSRNSYLTVAERRQALSLYQALENVRNRALEGERDVPALREELAIHFKKFDRVEADYIEFVDPEMMEPIVSLKGRVLVAIAAFVNDKVRLIDNMTLDIDAMDNGELQGTS